MTLKEKGAAMFSSRLAMILTCMGMAVGTGNIWRFPREVAKNGGGSFLIPWIIFLVLWSVPLLMVELSAGQKTRRGPFGAFATLLGKNYSWMGGFISLCAMLIMCYYAVVTGWTVRYLIYAVDGTLSGLDDAGAITLFDNFRSTPGALLFHLIAIGFAAFVVHKGTSGIERLNKVLIPLLISILIIGAAKSIHLAMTTDVIEGAQTGLGYLFSVDWSLLAKPSHWIAGLTQSAWSTGAGWGLMLAYAVYARDNEDPVTTPMATGSGNNGIEMLVALMIFPALFAILGLGATDYLAGSSWKGGVAFQVVPMLFNKMSGGYFFNLLFFIGLASAALTSLVAMVELSTRFFMDFKLSRKTALGITVGMCIVIGAPSALSDAIFDNQDFVWGVGLILSGLFLAFMVLKFGVNKYRDEYLNANAAIKVGGWFNAAMILIIIQGAVLLSWWLVNSGDRMLTIWCFVQWGVLILFLVALEKKLLHRMLGESD